MQARPALAKQHRRAQCEAQAEGQGDKRAVERDVQVPRRLIEFVFGDRAFGADRGAALEGGADREDGEEQADRKLDPDLAEVPLVDVEDEPHAEPGHEDRRWPEQPWTDEADCGREARESPRNP